MDKKRSTKYAYHWKKSWKIWKIRRTWWELSGGSFYKHFSNMLLQHYELEYIWCWKLGDASTNTNSSKRLEILHKLKMTGPLPAISANPKGLAERLKSTQFTLSLRREHVVHVGFGSKKQSKHATVAGILNLFECFNWRSHHCFFRVNHLEVLRQLLVRLLGAKNTCLCGFADPYFLHISWWYENLKSSAQ